MDSLGTLAAFSLKNILFLTDLTEASQQASVHAVALARRFGSRLYPAHVIGSPLSVEDEPSNTQSDTTATAAKIHDALVELVGGAGVEYQPLVYSGTVENAVIHWVTEHAIDLIVTGTHGRRGVEWGLLGSTAEAILKSASCPVLTVGPNATHGLSTDGKTREVLFVTGMPAASRASVSYALSMAREVRAKMTVLHVYPKNTSYCFGSGDNEVKLHERHRLLPLEEHLDEEPELIVEKGSIEERALDHALRKLPDLVVLAGLRKKGFSTLDIHVTYKIISASPTAVLTLPN